MLLDAAKGGGVAIIHKLNIPVKRVPTKKSPSHFELLECNISASRKNFRLFVIYRPPPSRANKFKTSSFFEEWLDFLDYTMGISDDIILTGDLNFHLDDKFDFDARKFTETLSDRGLVQHFVGATHVRGHTLDVIITREDSSIVMGIPSIEELHLCNDKGVPSLDHFAVHCSLNVNKPPKNGVHEIP
ncbi:unnamed protein product [Mytilus coruscus]|uniref:Endonuclease/exonuclease/phosphatase domain-containing protein n=1 Tax=Mytilus coruscus TaxID=42192 RepID=A0A6J8B852_MYTCO|nr:unnamed protein product [Mytilus coruscus]